MKQRNLIAKKNLKKSIYLGGGMAAFTAAIGLAVSIPVYNSIQEQLKQTTSKLKDLSGMMSELTSKLGIPEGASFQKELAGGYEVVYENGQTKIYKNNGEGKSLIINMNGDGTVGSAAQMQGPAAQTMLGVIQNAKASMEDDTDAMADIIGPFADQAEDTSLATESAVTGESVAALAQRNALSAGDNQKAKEQAAKRLAALEARNKAINAEALEHAKVRAQQLKDAAEKAKADAEKLAAAEKAGNAKALQDLKDKQGNASAAEVSSFVNYLDADNPSSKTLFDIQAKIDEDTKSKATPTTPTASSAADSADEAYDAPGALDDNQIIIFADILKGWGTVIGKVAPKSTDGADASRKFIKEIHDYINNKLNLALNNDDKNKLKVELQSLKIKAADERLKAIKAEVDAAVEKAKVAATQKTTSHQMDHAAAAGHVTPAIVKLAKSLPNAINALMAAKYGYLKDGVYKNPSTSVFKLIKDAMTGQGVSASTFDTIEKDIIEPLYESTKVTVDGHEIPGTISFSEVVNTFALKETTVNRLLVIKASYKLSSGTKENVDQLFLANQTTKSPIDFETTGDKLQSIKSKKDDGSINGMYTAANYLVEAINRKINSSITKEATMTLKRVVNNGADGALKGIKDPLVFYELVKVAQAIKPDNPIQEKALVDILLPLAKKYLFQGKDVKVNGDEIVQLIKNSFIYDETQEPTITLDATQQDTPIEYGPLTTSIIQEINDDEFTDYSTFTKGASPLVSFAKSDMLDIKKVEQLMNDKSIVDNLPNLIDLHSSEEGKKLMETNWDIAFATIARSDVNDVLKLIDNQKYAQVTKDMDKLKDILAIKGTPIATIDANLNKLFDSIKATPTNAYLLKDHWSDMGLELLQSDDFVGSLSILNETEFKDITANVDDLKELFAIQGVKLNTVHDYLKAIMDAMGATWVKNNKQWMLDNVKNPILQSMIKDTNKEYIMTNVDVRTKLLTETSIDDSLTKLDAIISAMTLQWVKDNQQWVLTNLDNPILQSMIKDANKEYIMTNVDVRTKLLTETSIDDSLTKLDAIISAMTLQWVKDNQQWVLTNMDSDYLQDMIKDANKDLFMSDLTMRDSILKGGTAMTLSNFDNLISVWGYAGITKISDEEKSFRNIIIHQNVDDKNIQTALKTGDMTSDQIHKAFDILSAQGYIASSKSSNNDKVKEYASFASRVSTNKEFILSIISQLGKYNTGHDELIKGDYINKVINYILGDEDFAKIYSDYAIKQIDLTSTILEKAKTDSIYNLDFAVPYDEFIFMNEDTKLEVIKSVKTLVNYINQFEDTDGTDEIEITNFVMNLEKHIFDASTSMDIDKVTAYIQHMIDRTNQGRTPNTDYASQGDKDGTMRQIKMYGDKFFATDAVVDQKVGDDATSSLNQVKALEAKAGPVGSPARARLALISKFPTIADAWQSGIVDAKPVVDPAFASQADQAIPSVIKSIGYDDARRVFYIVGNLNKAGSIGSRPAGRSIRHEVDSNGKILFDENKGNSLFLFEASLVEKDGIYTMEYHRVTSMDFKIEDQYNIGQADRMGKITYVDANDHSKGIKVDDSKQPLKKLGESSVSTYNPSQHSFVVYGSGGSYGHGHTVFKYENGKWTATLVDWVNGKSTAVGAPLHAAGAPAVNGETGGHSIGEYHYIGTSTIIGSQVYAPDQRSGVWYAIEPNGVTNGILFSSVPSEYMVNVQPDDKAKPPVYTWKKFPSINMIASVTKVKDETSGTITNNQWAVFVDWNTKELLKVNIQDHTMSKLDFYETDKDGHQVLSKQLFENCQAITTTDTGSIYITAGNPIKPAIPEVKAVAGVKEVKNPDGTVKTKGVAAVTHKDAVAEQPGTQQVYRIFLSDGKWQIEKVGNVIEDLKNPITSIYHYTENKVDADGNPVMKDGKQVQEQYIVAISLDGVKVIKDIFAQ